MDGIKNEEGKIPDSFSVKYLGCKEARGLWGIKHTRKPVDILVESIKSGVNLIKSCILIVTSNGCKLHAANNPEEVIANFPVQIISYGVQDLIYTRIFAIITVSQNEEIPFVCHAFACDSRQTARKLTYCLATAFHEYSQKVRDHKSSSISHQKMRKFAIDLRTPEELQTDSEA